MAQSFLGQVLGSVRNLFSGAPSAQPAPAAPAAAPSDGRTGVQKYLETLAAEAQPKLTGVEKYLAQLAEEEAAKAPAQLGFDTGVGKYLAALAENPSPAAGTGVQRYLAALAAEAAVVEESAEDKAATAGYRARAGGKTGVAAYLDAQGLTEAAADEAPSAPAAGGKSRVEQYLASLSAAKAEAPAPAPAEAAAPVVEEAPVATAAAEPAASGLIDLSADAKRCQGSTLKGTQCRNTSGLERIQRTIDGKDYQFAACAQHAGESFKPFRELLGG